MSEYYWNEIYCNGRGFLSLLPKMEAVNIPLFKRVHMCVLGCEESGSRPLSRFLFSKLVPSRLVSHSLVSFAMCTICFSKCSNRLRCAAATTRVCATPLAGAEWRHGAVSRRREGPPRVCASARVGGFLEFPAFALWRLLPPLVIILHEWIVQLEVAQFNVEKIV
jgi:hypothetical protein